MATLEIRQLEAPSRVLVLSGSALPLQGFSWGAVQQRGVVRYYPGSGQGSTHLQGAQWSPVELSFSWRTHKLAVSRDAVADGTAVDDADALVELLVAMVADTVLVSVRWQGVESVGYLSELDPEVGRIGRRAVALTFTPATRDGASPGRTPAASDAGSTLDGIVDILDGLLSSAAVPALVADRYVADVERDLNALASTVNRGVGVVEQYQATTRGAAELRGGLASVLGGMVGAAGAVVDTVEMANASAIPSDDPASAINVAAFQAEVGVAAGKVRRDAHLEQRRQQLGERVDVIGIHTGREGESLRLVAWQVYGDPQVWQQVAEFNGLRGSILSAGQRVLLPRLVLGV